ncbi:MAG: polysaccharide deacetylase family protein [Bacteroidetes bacterium]|nr:MAG: polysaccharide deacetylase family protein [Bacteroidota bacterium]
MSFYLTKIPDIVKPLASDLIWNLSPQTQTLYLTFDDGPVVGVTDWVLEILDRYNAKATFFCVGENVERNPELFEQIIKQGHSVANHSYNHLNGWKTSNFTYYRNVLKADELIGSKLFRPPYGKITRQQVKSLKKKYKIIMWDVLSGDFDENLKSESCIKNVIKASKSGSIIVFHDSEKSKSNLMETLPEILRHYTVKGYSFKNIDQDEKFR